MNFHDDSFNSFAGKCKLCEPKKPADETRSLVRASINDRYISRGRPSMIKAGEPFPLTKGLNLEILGPERTGPVETK